MEVIGGRPRVYALERRTGLTMSKLAAPLVALLVLAGLAPAAEGRSDVQGGKSLDRGGLAQDDKPPANAWELLRQKHDGNKDGRISADEYDRGEDRFQRLDRNSDGVLTEDDFPEGGRGRRGGGGRGGRGRMGGFVSLMLVRGADENEDGAVTKTEWRGFLESLNANEDGVIDGDGLMRLRPRGRGDRGGQGRRGGQGGRGGSAVASSLAAVRPVSRPADRPRSLRPAPLPVAGPDREPALAPVPAP